MKNLIFIPLLAFVFIYSCKKEEESQGSPSNIELGNTANMIVQPFNTVITTSNQHLIGLDLNNNSTVDLKFIVEMTSNGTVDDNFYVGMYSPSEEITMNGTFISDTTYSFESTSIVTDSISSKVWLTEESNYNCYRLNPLDIITGYTPPNLKLTYYNTSEKLYLQDTYSTRNNYPLWNVRADRLPYITSVSGDTTYFKQIKFDISCNNMGSGIKYIGFKDISTQKLGWIKLEYISNSSIKLFEVAIQK